MEMRVAVDVSGLKTGHQFRGVGIYTRRLTEALKKNSFAGFSLVEFEGNNIPSESDLVHHPFFDFFFLSLPLLKAKPTIVTIHDCTPLVFPENYPPGLKGSLKYQIQKFSLKGVKRVITDSQNSKKDIVHFLNYPEDRIDVVPLAAGNELKKITDFKTLEAIKRKYLLPGKFVLYVGDVNYNKNLPGLVKACRKIGISLAVVGKQAVSENFDRGNIENKPLIDFLKLVDESKDVFRLGFVKEEELAGLYSLAACYCQPSFYEGFGMQILEAMGCGCPVVASETSSFPEVAGKAATLVNPDSIENIAEGIKKTIEDQEFRDKIIKAGFTQVKKFSWQKTARETIKVYEKVLEKHNR